MPAAMTLINSQTISSAVGTVTFSSIPGTYRDLRIVVYANNIAQDIGTIYLNSDSTWANYSRVAMYGDGTSAQPSSGSDPRIVEMSGYCTITIDLLDYSATDKHKTGLARASSANFQVRATAFRWANTAAVTNVQVISTSWPVGSVLSLYGIAG